MLTKLARGAGAPDRLGAHVVPGGVNFAVYSETAERIYVCVFDDADAEIARLPLDGQRDHVHFGLVAGIVAGTRYGLRADGPWNPAEGLWFDPNKLLVDPYARRLDRPYVRVPELALPRDASVDTAPFVPRAIVPGSAPELAQPRRRGPQVFYEINVRGYTMRHPQVQPGLRGTIAGLTQKPVLNHLKQLGVDIVQLMPVSAFIDEGHLPPLGLRNAWGYNPVGYFAIDPRLAPGGPEEMRALTDVYRKAGISVILDVVYNHTGESDTNGPNISMRGLDAKTYYRHVAIDGRQVLVNDTGTGNTLRCDHPAVQRMVIDSLVYWVEELGVSGFRFDLAPVLGREPGFNPNARLLEMIRSHPVLGKAILVAEPWDPGPGGYQLGRFGKGFHEHNDTYRDDVRSFWRGDGGKIGALAGKVAGSSEIFNFGGRKPSAGVNFLAVHDGFTLADLVSYVDKHNEANGEQNRDGHSSNYSWNCGVEGQTEDAGILAARRRDVRALLATLFLSRGLVLFQQGDELGRTQRGNNNAYAQDNELTWVDWASADWALAEFVGSISRFRREHPALTHDHFLTGQPKNGVRDVVWMHPDGREMAVADWNEAGASVLGIRLTHGEDDVMVWFNRRIDPVLARLPEGYWKAGLCSDDRAVVPVAAGAATLPPRAVVVLVRSHILGD